MITINEISDNVLRDLFAMNAPNPTEGDIEMKTRQYKNRNPYNEPGKPKLPSRVEIECELRYEWADTMLRIKRQSQSTY